MKVLPRKLPRQTRSVDTVACVLEAAARILEEEGQAGFNTNAVAKRAGISVGSLYQYFPSKEAIMSSLVLRTHERIVEGMHRLLLATEQQTFSAAIDAMLAMVVAGEPRSPRLARILEAEEDRLAKTPAILAAEVEIDALNRIFFGRYLKCDANSLAIAAADLVAIVGAMLATGERVGMEDRLRRTVLGYLAPLLPAEPPI